MELAGDELGFAKGYLSGFMLILWVADRTGGYTVTTPARNVIRISSKTNTNEITLNPGTLLPAQVLAWADVQGVHFPARELNSHKDAGSADIRTEQVTFNSNLKPIELAAKPRDRMPVLAGH
jgi:hypothetical protein